MPCFIERIVFITAPGHSVWICVIIDHEMCCSAGVVVEGIRTETV